MDIVCFVCKQRARGTREHLEDLGWGGYNTLMKFGDIKIRRNRKYCPEHHEDMVEDATIDLIMFKEHSEGKFNPKSQEEVESHFQDVKRNLGYLIEGNKENAGGDKDAHPIKGQ